MSRANGCGAVGPNGYTCTRHARGEHVARGIEPGSFAESWPLPAPIRQRDIAVERLHSGGYLLAVMHNGRRIASRYFEYSLREAKQRFLADIRAGVLS